MTKAELWQVVRVSLNALKNLLLASGLDVGPEMVDSGLQKVVTQRKQQVLPAKRIASQHTGKTGVRVQHVYL